MSGASSSRAVRQGQGLKRVAGTADLDRAQRLEADSHLQATMRGHQRPGLSDEVSPA